MEAWRQWLLGRRKNLVQQKSKRIDLTPTGLLMEGDFTCNRLVTSDMAIFEQLSGSRLAASELT
jgi:hypothetical protein